MLVEARLGIRGGVLHRLPCPSRWGGPVNMLQCGEEVKKLKDKLKIDV